jgi:hypothetical protein
VSTLGLNCCSYLLTFLPRVSREGSEEAQWDVEAWHELTKLAKEEPKAGVWIQDKTTYYRNEDKKQESLNLWFKSMVHDVRLPSQVSCNWLLSQQ